MQCTLELPLDYEVAAFLAYHARDPFACAEIVTQSTLSKGISCDHAPAVLSISFMKPVAQVSLTVDNPASRCTTAYLTDKARFMLGLNQPVEALFQHFGNHPQIGQMITRHSGLRIALSLSPFEALTWAVTGQQISIAAATSLRRRLIELAGIQHSSGLFCYPDAHQLSQFSANDFRAIGFSQSKAKTLVIVSHEVSSNRLPLEDWLNAPDIDAISKQLIDIPGIGPWTTSYTLLRGYGYLDGSLHADTGVQRGLQKLLGITEKPGADFTALWLKEFSPWRALIAAHLWSLNS